MTNRDEIRIFFRGSSACLSDFRKLYFEVMGGDWDLGHERDGWAQQ